MTVKEYNTVFYPKISHAELFVKNMKHAIEKTENPKDVKTQLACIGWSDECKETILEALECYKATLYRQIN